MNVPFVFLSLTANLIREKEMTIDDVPAEMRDAFLEYLHSIGLDGYGDPYPLKE